MSRVIVIDVRERRGGGRKLGVMVVRGSDRGGGRERGEEAGEFEKVPVRVKMPLRDHFDPHRPLSGLLVIPWALAP